MSVASAEVLFMTSFVAGWQHVEQDGPVGFNVRMDWNPDAFCSHNHEHGEDVEAYVFLIDCRPCQVTEAILSSGLQFQLRSDGSTFIAIDGWAQSSAQKVALSRFMALARRHLDPLVLVEARQLGLPV
jgi:hypothetical protein